MGKGKFVFKARALLFFFAILLVGLLSPSSRFKCRLKRPQTGYLNVNFKSHRFHTQSTSWHTPYISCRILFNCYYLASISTIMEMGLVSWRPSVSGKSVSFADMSQVSKELIIFSVKLFPDPILIFKNVFTKTSLNRNLRRMKSRSYRLLVVES